MTLNRKNDSGPSLHPLFGAHLLRRDPALSADDSAADSAEALLARLGIEHRTVVVLKHYVGLSNSEVATAMDIPEGTVRSRLYNALQALRAALEADRRSRQDATR